MNTSRIIRLKMQIVLLSVTIVAAVALYIRSYNDEARLNAIDRSFTALYNDRLVAEKCVFMMNDLIHEKKMLQVNAGNAADNAGTTLLQQELFRKLNEVYTEFRNTKLSSEELTIADQLNGKIREIAVLENSNTESHISDKLKASYNTALLHLEALSDIQIKEGTKLRNDGHEAVASSMVGLKFSFAIFIVFLLCLLALLRQFTIHPRFAQQHELN